MQAVLVTALSPDLSGVELAEVERPRGEVVVRMRAASLNYPDLLMTRGEYQFKPEPPFIAGLEMAGEVVEAAPGSGFAVGDRVRGGAKTGAFAEYVALPASALRHMPEVMDFPAAAAMGAAGGEVKRTPTGVCSTRSPRCTVYAMGRRPSRGRRRCNVSPCCSQRKAAPAVVLAGVRRPP